MRSAPVNFITLHYAWIVFLGLLSLPVLYPYGNLNAVDAYFFGASASTESGLNTYDINNLALYQQLYIYFVPMFTNLGFMNIMVVIVRLHWFNKRIDRSGTGPRAGSPANKNGAPSSDKQLARIKFHLSGKPTPRKSDALWAPGREGERGRSLIELAKPDSSFKDDVDADSRSPIIASGSQSPHRHLSELKSLKRAVSAASSIFAFRSAPTKPPFLSIHPTQRHMAADNTTLSQTATGRRSRFYNLTSKDREELGGVEYRSLRLLLKIVTGNLCCWIQYADTKYTAYLEEVGQDKTWWAFYLAQSMVDNLGYTLTPDNMIHFRDAVVPLLILSFLGLAGETLYPVFLRFVIWTMSKLTPRESPMQKPLAFLLNYPRRCYTLLFPGGTTWALLVIIIALNLVDTLLLVVLDLHNPDIAGLTVGECIAAALFQAVASRHAGMTPYNLSSVSPAAQFSLLVMMYISIFPIAISIRASNTYEESALGIYGSNACYNENKGGAYLVRHIQQQLSFDLWYIFLGIFCLAVSEASKLKDPNDPAFQLFPIFFEVVSAYGNVGISLGHPSTSASLSAKFSVFGKLVVCATMIRGRHRVLPHQLDRAIMLPDEHLLEPVAERE
ncbi:Low-affinity potassium transport protein [Tolypocladium ophioglossoides CBS 100239]|uniref:Low-affinity potassium transport protein n=1 Tax=Tolypocladium ophioglossoides (strain CBS 100239) TaxID=1163406 RepID=A0A0L0MZP7_TOLOC|nr:Low-affinity potassium transport protein [Tolypocladium ophioglossoides CBS 100239]